VNNLAAANQDGDVYIAVEGGVRWTQENDLECFAWVVVKWVPEVHIVHSKTASTPCNILQLVLFLVLRVAVFARIHIAFINFFKVKKYQGDISPLFIV